MTKKGRKYENQTANEVSNTDEDVLCWTAGYSGSNAVPSPDLVAITPRRSWGWELKRSTTTYVELTKSELEQLCSTYRPYFHVGLVVTWSNRAPLVIEPELPPDQTDIGVIENFKRAIPSAFDPRETAGGEEASLRLTKPDLDDWPSARAGVPASTKLCKRMLYEE